jgi:hypothetical protein
MLEVSEIFHSGTTKMVKILLILDDKAQERKIASVDVP